VAFRDQAPISAAAMLPPPRNAIFHGSPLGSSCRAPYFASERRKSPSRCGPAVAPSRWPPPCRRHAHGERVRTRTGVSNRQISYLPQRIWRGPPPARNGHQTPQAQVLKPFIPSQREESIFGEPRLDACAENVHLNEHVQRCHPGRGCSESAVQFFRCRRLCTQSIALRRQPGLFSVLGAMRCYSTPGTSGRACHLLQRLLHVVLAEGFCRRRPPPGRESPDASSHTPNNVTCRGIPPRRHGGALDAPLLLLAGVGLLP